MKSFLYLVITIIYVDHSGFMFAEPPTWCFPGITGFVRYSAKCPAKYPNLNISDYIKFYIFSILYSLSFINHINSQDFSLTRAPKILVILYNQDNYPPQPKFNKQ